MYATIFFSVKSQSVAIKTQSFNSFFFVISDELIHDGNVMEYLLTRIEGVDENGKQIRYYECGLCKVGLFEECRISPGPSKLDEVVDPCSGPRGPLPETKS